MYVLFSVEITFTLSNADTSRLADDAEFWFDFGDGSFQDWQPLPDDFRVGSATCPCSHVFTHAYQESGFYDVHMIIRNLASVYEIRDTVSEKNVYDTL